MKRVSIVVPCHNEEEALPLFYKELSGQFELLTDYELEVIMVDDGSMDKTLDVMKELAEKDTRVKYISLSRNFGKEAAMYAGFCNSRGDYVAVMDADLQDPPSLLDKMLEILETGEYDSVATRRVTRKGEPRIRSFFARIFYKLLNRFSDADVVDGARDFRLMNKDMVESVISLTEYNRFSKGIFGWIGFKTYWLEFENQNRIAGESSWSFWGLLRYAIDGLINFTDFPLTFAYGLGVAMTIISFLGVIYIVIKKLLFGNPVAGWASTASIITFIGGIQFFCLGIIGKYLSKVYIEVKHRPHYIVAKTNIEDMDRIR